MDALSHRKATAHLRIVDGQGNPVQHCPIQADQVSHAFLFGCGASDAFGMQAAKTEERRAFHQARAEKWLELFNYGTLHFYWGRYEPVPGQTIKEPMMKAANWLRERGVTLKGHPLCWHTVCANWLLEYDNEEILRRQLERIHREVTDFKGVIDKWDVINEVVIMPHFDKYDNAVTRICNMKGRLGLVKEVFAAAHESNPKAQLLINDFNLGDGYDVLIDAMLDAGVPVGTIGIQSHQHQGYWGLERVQRVLERYARFGLPLHFTENTLISGELMPKNIVDLNDFQVKDWPTTPEGEERQKNEITEMYSALFAHPAVQAITTWDFTDDCWLNAPAGLIRKDNSEKPAFKALKSLIHGAWETHEDLRTDENGCVTLTGFKGGYSLTGNGRTASVTLAEDGEQTVTL